MFLIIISIYYYIYKADNHFKPIEIIFLLSYLSFFTFPFIHSYFITTSITFTQSTLQNQGAASDYYSGAIQCNIYVPKGKGSSVMSALGEAVIDGLTSINASDYSDPFSCSPRVGEVSGIIPVEIEDRSHFLGIVSCAFFANS